MSRSFCFILCSACILLIAIVCSQDVTFVTPPPQGPRGVYQDNPVYSYGSNITVRWILDGDIPEDVEALDLYFMQEFLFRGPPDYHGGMILSAISLSTSEVWFTIDMNMMNGSDDGASPLYLQLNEAGTFAGLSGTSHYFNVTGPSESPTSSTSSTKSTTTASKTSTSTTTSPDSTQLATRTASTSPTSSITLNLKSQSGKALSKTSIPGIAIGATIGGILVLGGLGFFAWRHGMWSRALSNNLFTSDKKTTTSQDKTAELPADNNRSELPENSYRAELPAGRGVKDGGDHRHTGGDGSLHELP